MQVSGSGRLTTDPVVKEFEGKDGNTTKMALFTLAENVTKTVSNFYSCQAYGSSAEFLEKYATKGSFMAVEGHLKTWKDKDTGHTKMAVVVDRVNMPKISEAD